MTIWDQWLHSTDPNIQAAFNKVQGTQQYLELTPAYQNSIHDILWKLGVDPGGQAEMAGVNMDFSNDPYSVVNLLKRQETEGEHSAINDVNAAGLEQSGAAVGALNANNEAYKKGYQQAVDSAMGDIHTATGQYTTGVGGIFDKLEQAPPTIDATAAPAAPPPVNLGSPAQQAAGTGPGSATPTPQSVYNRTGPEAGGVVQQLKKPVTIKPGVMGGRGHIT